MMTFVMTFLVVYVVADLVACVYVLKNKWKIVSYLRDFFSDSSLETRVTELENTVDDLTLSVAELQEELESINGCAADDEANPSEHECQYQCCDGCVREDK